MQDLGGIKHALDFTLFLDAAKLLYEGPWVAERYVAIEKIITEQADELLPVIKTIIGGAKNKTAMDAFKAEYQMQVYRAKSKNVVAQYDFILTPTAGTIYTIDEVNADPIVKNSNLGYYTNYMNLLDCACVAVPSGFLDNGLPWGVSLVSTAMSDRKLLSYANKWQQQLKIKPGNVNIELQETVAAEIAYTNSIQVIVCGAHLNGLALNWQLTERGAKLIETTTTTDAYRMYVIEGSLPRPALVRDDENGSSISIEIWQLPKSEFGSFVAGIASPLGIGKVETSDGRLLPGFICEGYAVKEAKEITELGAWRQYLSS